MHQIPKDIGPKNDRLLKNVLILVAPHVGVAGAHIGDTAMIALVCVEGSVAAGVLFVVTVVYTDIVKLMMNAVLKEAFLHLPAFL